MLWQLKCQWYKKHIQCCKSSLLTPQRRHPPPCSAIRKHQYYTPPGDQLVSRNISRNIAAIRAGVERHFSRAKVNFMNDPWAFLCSASLHGEGQGQHWHLLIRGGYVHSLASAEKQDAHSASARVGGSHIYLYSISVVSSISPSPFKHCTFSMFSLMPVSAKKRWQRGNREDEGRQRCPPAESVRKNATVLFLWWDLPVLRNSVAKQCQMWVLDTVSHQVISHCR